VTLTEAAEAWIAYRRKLAAVGPEPKEAAKVLKTWFRSHPGKRAFKGVGYAFSTYPGLDLDKVRAELDPKALKRCEVVRERETLSVVEPAKNAG
jgi:hypothetical protein